MATGENLRTPLFVIALALLTLAVLLELGSPYASELLSAGNAVSLDEAEIASLQSLPQLADIPSADIEKELQAEAGDKPPGRGVPYLILLDSLLLLTVGLMGASLLVPERLHGRLQGIVTLVVSLLILLAGIKMVFTALAELMLMITLLMAVPFGTLVYLVKYGSFDRGSASAILSLVMLLKLGFAGCLALAQQRFLAMKGLVLIVLTSLVAGLVVSFLHGFVPGILVSITDAVAGIVVAILAILWAVFLLLGSVFSVVAALKPKV